MHDRQSIREILMKLSQHVGTANGMLRGLQHYELPSHVQANIEKFVQADEGTELIQSLIAALERPDGLPAVEWHRDDEWSWRLTTGRIRVFLYRNDYLGNWCVRVPSLFISSQFVCEDEASAKSEALRLTQAAVREAAEAWRVGEPSSDARVEQALDSLSKEAESIERAYGSDDYDGDLDVDEAVAETIWMCIRTIRASFDRKATTNEQ